MDQSDIPIPQAVDVKIETETSSTPEGVPVEESPLDSVAKPLVEQVSQAAKSLMENVDPSYVTQLEKGVENLVSDPLAALKNLGAGNPAPTSGGTEEAVLPTSDKNVCESSVSERAIDDPEKADSDANPRSTHTQV